MERLLAWYRVGSSAGAVAALVAANLVPLIGVLWFGWSMWTILTIYWVENGIVGFFNVLKMAAVPGIGKLGVIPFFVVHYGMFWFVHGIFVFALPSFAGLGGRGECIGSTVPDGLPADFPTDLLPGLASSACTSPFGTLVWSNVALAAAALFLSHGASFFLNYLGKGEYLTTSAARQAVAPYGRVVMLHVTIILGAFIIAFVGAPIGALLVLVVLKTAFDLGLHLREHGAAP